MMSLYGKTYGFLSRQVLLRHLHGFPQFEDGQPNGGPKKFEKELKRGPFVVMMVFPLGLGNGDGIGSLRSFEKNGVI